MGCVGHGWNLNREGAAGSLNLGEEVIVEEGQDWALVPIVEHHSTDLELRTATDRSPPLRYIAALKVESSRDTKARGKDVQGQCAGRGWPFAAQATADSGGN